MNDTADKIEEVCGLTSAELNKHLFTSLAVACEGYANHLVDMEVRFNADECEIIVRARWQHPGNAMGRRFSMSFKLEPEEEG